MKIQVTQESAVQTAIAFGDWRSRLHDPVDDEEEDDEFEEDEDTDTDEVPEVGMYETERGTKTYWVVTYKSRKYTIVRGGRFLGRVILTDDPEDPWHPTFKQSLTQAIWSIKEQRFSGVIYVE